MLQNKGYGIRKTRCLNDHLRVVELPQNGKAVNRIKVSVVVTMPPTSNNIYVNIPGGRTKTTEARSWQNRAVKTLIRDAKLGFQNGLNPNKRYLLIMVFYFEQIKNKGWDQFYKRGAKKGQRKAETKWKKIDLSNRVKLAEDTMKIATGVDDSATMAHLLIKEWDPKNPRLVMELIELPEVDNG